MASTPPIIPGSPARDSQSEASDAILALSTVIDKIISKRQKINVEVHSSQDKILALSTLIADKIIGKRERMDVEEVILVLAEKHEKHKNELDGGPGVAAKLFSKYSRHLRDGINIYENASNLDDALKCFTASIAHAGFRTLLLVTCQIRAFSLEIIGNYDAAVAELDRALLSNPSSEMKQVLEDQKAECLQEKTADATASMVEQPGPWLGPQPSETYSESFNGSVDGTAGEQWSRLLELSNPHTPNPFPRIRYAYDANRGQYLEAAEDIDSGQFIISDKYWTVRLEDEFKYEYCSYCFKRCVTLIPCPFCSRELYCGETCQKEASDSYHRLECKITNTVSSWSTRETMLTRMILVSTGQGRRLNDLMKTVKAREIFSPGFCASAAFGQAYPRVLRLRAEYNREIINKYVSTAARIIVRLERVGFFNVNSRPESPLTYPLRYHQRTLTEAQVFTGILLLNYALALKTHSVEFVSYEYRLTCTRNRAMGVGVTALPSVLRHSCHPNARILNHHRDLVIVAERGIRKGEEILVSYIKNAHYDPDHAIRERLVPVFLHHGYECKCSACANELPTLKQLKESPPNNIKKTSARARIWRKPSPEKPASAATSAVDEGLSKLSLEDVSKEASPMVTARPPGLDSSAESSSTEPESRRKKTATLPSQRRTTIGPRKVGTAKRAVVARTVALQKGDPPEELGALKPPAIEAAESSEAALPMRIEETSGEADTSKAPAAGSDLPETPSVRATSGNVEEPRSLTTTERPTEETTEHKGIWKPNVPGVPFITLRDTYGIRDLEPWNIEYELLVADAPSEAPPPEMPENDTSDSYYAWQRLFRSRNLQYLDRRQTLTHFVLGLYNTWRQGVHEPLNTIAKSDEYADLILAVGQTKYSDEEFLEAVNYFTLCLAYAPNQSPFMMTALLQRARALYHMRMYDDALATIQYAQDTENYLDEGRRELDELKRMCEDGKRAPPPDSPKKKETKEEAQARKTKAAKAKKPAKGTKSGKGAAKMPKKEDAPKPWKEPNFRNANIPNATSKVKFVYDQDHGRCLEATEDIEAGEPIIFHGYTFTVLDEDQAYLGCAYCLKRSYSMIPCPGCVENMYCSAACLQKAYDEYHRLECKIWTPFRANAEPRPVSQDVMMMIRMMLVNTKQGSEWTKLVDRLAEPKEVFSPAIPDDVGDAPIDDYVNVLRWRRVNDWITMARDAVVPCIVVYMLKFAGFFQDDSGPASSIPDTNEMTLEELMAALIFLNHSVTMDRQRFPVGPPPDSEVMGDVVSALPTVIPHDCFCNTAFIASDRDFVAFAVRPVKRGEKLTMGYFATVPCEPKWKRQEDLLLGIGVDCKCVACTDDMPSIDVIQRKMPEYANSVTIKKARTALIGIGRPAADEVYFKKMSYKEMMRMVKIVFKWMEEHLEPPYYYETHLLKEATNKLLCLQYDDYHTGIADMDGAKEFVRDCILLTMKRAGIDVKSLPRMC